MVETARTRRGGSPSRPQSMTAASDQTKPDLRRRFPQYLT